MKIMRETLVRLKHRIFAVTHIYRLIFHYNRSCRYRPQTFKLLQSGSITQAGLREAENYLNHGLIQLLGDYRSITEYNQRFGCTYASKPWWSLKVTHLNIDLKYLWEINRHQHFPLLALASRLPEYRAQMVEQLRSELEEWLQVNPPEKGINWLSNQEIALRAISWTLTYDLLHPESDLLWNHFLVVLLHHGRHLEKNLSYTKACMRNNHLLGELSALVILGLFFDRSGWINHYRELDEEIQFQFYPDGINFEQSINYHRFTLDLLLLTCNILKSRGMILSYTAQHRLENAAQFVPWIQKPDASFPNIGDNGNACAIHPEIRNMLDLETSCLPEDITAKNFRAFPDGGFYIWKSGWTKNDSYLMIKAGPHANHAHADLLHFEYSYHGENIFVDSGTYQYNRAPFERLYFRSTPAHNTLSVKGKNQSMPFKTFRWLSTSRRRDISYARADSKLSTVFSATVVYPSGNLNHRRVLETSEQLSPLIIHDYFHHAAYAVAYFHIDPRNQIHFDGAIQPVSIITPSGRNLQITFESPNHLDIQFETVPYSEQYGDLRPHLRINVRITRKKGEGYLKTTILDPTDLDIKKI